MEATKPPTATGLNNQGNLSAHVSVKSRVDKAFKYGPLTAPPLLCFSRFCLSLHVDSALRLASLLATHRSKTGFLRLHSSSRRETLTSLNH